MVNFTSLGLAYSIMLLLSLGVNLIQLTKSSDQIKAHSPDASEVGNSSQDQDVNEEELGRIFPLPDL